MVYGETGRFPLKINIIDFIQELSLAQSNNRNTQINLIIMDFAKAFDKVSHRHLLYKLKFYGIKNNTKLDPGIFTGQNTNSRH